MYQLWKGKNALVNITILYFFLIDKKLFILTRWRPLPFINTWKVNCWRVGRRPGTVNLLPTGCCQVWLFSPEFQLPWLTPGKNSLYISVLNLYIYHFLFSALVSLLRLFNMLCINKRVRGSFKSTNVLFFRRRMQMGQGDRLISVLKSTYYEHGVSKGLYRLLEF